MYITNFTILKNKIVNTLDLKKILDTFFILIPFIEIAFSYKINLSSFSFDLRLSYFIYFVYFVLYLPKFIKENSVKDFIRQKYLVVLFCVFILIQIYNILVGNNTFGLFFKQFLINLFILMTSIIFFYNNKNNLKYIIDIYLNISLFVCLIGIFQEIFYFIGLEPGYNFSLWQPFNQNSNSSFMHRVTSICYEPATLSVCLAMAFYIALYSFLTNDNIKFFNLWKVLVVIICFILTYSTIAYIGIIIALMLIFVKFIRKIRILNFIVFLLIWGFLFLLGSSEIITRIKSAVDLVSIQQNNNRTTTEQQQNNNRTTTEQQYHGTIYTLLIHSKIVLKVLSGNFLFGTGLGSYLNCYNKYAYLFFNNKSMQWIIEDFPCKDNSSSVLLRISAEIGFLGIISLILIIVYSYIWDLKVYNNLEYIVVLNSALLFFIFMKLIRSTIYYGEHFFLYLMLFYYTKQLYIKGKSI